MKVNKQARRDAKALFRACQANGSLDENLVRSTVDELLEHEPRGFLAILAHFQHLVKLDRDRHTALIESAVELNSDQEGAIKDQLRQRYGDGLMFTFETKPDLIGGMRVRVGSDVFDGTVNGRLRELEDSFKAA